MFLVPHTHWDREWYRPFQLFRISLVDVVDEVLGVLETDPRLVVHWNLFLNEIPTLFSERGFQWVDTENGVKLGCRPNDYPDLFHSDARCSALLRRALDRR